jgi:cytoskeletal protein CcmA (bactofilin family)
LQFIGEIKTSSILIVDAIIKENVVSENLNVSAQARIMGDVTASDLSVCGEITGGSVLLKSTANIVGVCLYDTLSARWSLGGRETGISAQV